MSFPGGDHLYSCKAIWWRRGEENGDGAARAGELLLAISRGSMSIKFIITPLDVKRRYTEFLDEGPLLPGIRVQHVCGIPSEYSRQPDK